MLMESTRGFLQVVMMLGTVHRRASLQPLLVRAEGLSLPPTELWLHFIYLVDTNLQPKRREASLLTTVPLELEATHW